MAITLSLPPGTGHPASQHSIKSEVFRWLALALFFLVLPASAQTSPGQRRVDFEQLAASVAKAYAPYQWKIDAFQYDALQIAPWLQRVAAAKDDLEYYEICMEYVASLRDLHSGYFLQSDFAAELPFLVDFYDGVALLESINRAGLPSSQYPFQIGDELVSVDGETALDWTARISRLQSFANPSATRRWALDQITFRVQQVIPRAHEVGARATVVVRRASTGALETYTMPWLKSGTPLTQIGPVPTPMSDSASTPRALRTERRTPAFKRLRNFGAVSPVFSLPADFVLRQGRNRLDPIYTGTYQSAGYTIGFLRIPEFPGSSSGRAAMLSAIDTEIAYFRANTSGLVVDVMRNPGGDVCLTNDILTRLINYPFRTVGDELRPTLDIVDAFRAEYQDAVDSGADAVTRAYLRSFLTDVETAYKEYRGITGPLPVCGFTLDLQPVPNAYDKAMIVLIDEFSTSSADVFPSILQDAGRALMFGKQTAGGGGLSVNPDVGFFTEGSVSLSISLGTRGKTVTPPGLPPTNYIENVGALPDIEVDYMTRDNLMTGGRAFVDAFTAAIVEHIRRQTP
jgi:Peptidase family S41